MLNTEDQQALAYAKHKLENPGLAIRMSDLLGAPIEKGLAKLPQNWHEKVDGITQTALNKAADAAIFTLQDEPTYQASNTWHKLGAAASGGLGGFFGLSAIALELPVSTTIMLRSIADIARSEGESINDIETRLACLEVFALGGRSDKDDGAESGYFAVRTALAKSVSDASEYLLKKGVEQKGGPLMVKFIQKVAERFGLQVTQKAAAQAIPALGAAGGALLNTLFIDHFQGIARGHFIIRRLERRYGISVVKAAYQAIPELNQ